MRLELSTQAFTPFKSILEGREYETLKSNILVLFMRQKDLLFRQSVDPDGRAWQPLSESTQKARMRKSKKAKLSKLQKEQIAVETEKEAGYFDTGLYNQKLSTALTIKKIGKILVDSAVMKNSLISPQGQGSVQTTLGDEIVYGTNVEYASIHNFGGTIQRKSKLDVKEKKSLTVIPARPFIGIGDKDEEQVIELVNDFVATESSKA